MQRRDFLTALGAVSVASLVQAPNSARAAAAQAPEKPRNGLDFQVFREQPGERGQKTMLFWDYWKLHHLDNVELVPGVPELVPESVYIDPYTHSPGTGRVFFDQASGKWRKIWGSTHFYVAESDDGIRWRPADLPQVKPPGEKRSPHHTFSLLERGHSYGWLYLDPIAADGYPYKIPVVQNDELVYNRAKANPAHRWHELTKKFATPRLHMYDHVVVVSRDGLEWEIKPEYDWGQGRIVPEEPQFMFFNHLTGEHSLVCRPGLGDRRVALTTTRDFREWSEPRLIQQPDLLDREILEFYAMPTFPYGQYFVGFVWASHFSTSDGPDFNVLHVGPQGSQLALSTDGQYFVRPVREQFVPFAPPGQVGCHSLRTEGMAVLDDEIRLYSTAGMSAHGTPVPPEFKGRSEACVMHRLRRDGWMYFRSKGYKAEFTTRPLVLFAAEVQLNALAPTGEVQYEVRDGLNRPVAGYTFADCKPLKFADALRHPLQWQDRQNLGELTGKVIRLAFRFHNAHLYSLRADYHFVDGFDVRRIADGLPIDTTRFGA